MSRLENFQNVIDLDQPNIPNSLKNHLISYHKGVFFRNSSNNNYHIITYQSERCKICESYCDEKFVRYRDSGKPTILWDQKGSNRVSEWKEFTEKDL